MPQSSRAEKEAQILRAAMDEFLERGVHGARMQSIADRAGVNKALLHYYFRSKDDLYKKTLEEITLPFWRTLNHRISELDPDDFEGAVRVIASHVVESALELPHSAILLSEFASGGQYISSMSRLVHAASHDSTPVLTFFAGLVERGVIKPANPLNVFVNILGMSWNIFLAEPFTTPILEKMGVTRDRAFYESYVDLIVEMSARGMVAP